MSPLPLRLAALALLGGAAAASLPGSGSAQEPTLVELTQTGCQFIEGEDGLDRGYSPSRAEDCRAINATTAAERLAGTQPLILAPGRYVFRVRNADVPYPLGFWLREKGYDPGNPLDRLTRTSVSGGGLTAGVAEDYPVELEAGEYLYSCPLNPTPDYRIVVVEAR